MAASENLRMTYFVYFSLSLFADIIATSADAPASLLYEASSDQLQDPSDYTNYYRISMVYFYKDQLIW